MKSLREERSGRHTTPEKNSGLLEHMLEYAPLKLEAEIPSHEVRDMLRSGSPMDAHIPSDVTSLLIKACAYVEYYQSDLIHDLDYIRSKMARGDESGVFLLGFRKSGVDGISYIESNFDDWYLSNNHSMMSEYYRRIYCVTYTTDDNGYIRFRVLDATTTHPYSDPFSEDYAPFGKKQREAS